MTESAATFELPRLERVVSGPGAIDALDNELHRRALSRAIVVTGRTLSSSPLLNRITRVLGSRLAGVFGGVRQHVPSCSVADLARLIERERADAVVSFGGGSPIDTAKAALHSLLSPDRAAGDEGPVHIAVPTTLSAGEFTGVAGVTHEDTRVKHAILDPRLAPRTVIADPALTLETPAWLWAASGVRAMDHAVESLYSARHHPLSDALAARGLAMLVEHLPRSLSTEGDTRLDHRSQCQMAAWMAVFGTTHAGFGLSHAVGHQIGPRFNVAHGVTSCIMLPHAMRFMAGRAPGRFRLIADGLGLAFDPRDAERSARACADRMETLLTGLGVPRRLGDVGVPAGELGQVAGIVHGLMDRAHVIDGDVSPAQIEALLVGAL